MRARPHALLRDHPDEAPEKGAYVPIYEYRCDNCERTFEKFQRSAAGDGAACPTCARPARRLLSTFALPRGAAPGPDDPEHPGPPSPAGGHDHGHGHGHGHGHSHGLGGHSHDALHGHPH